jgi:STE24 endopeptidase
MDITANSLFYIIIGILIINFVKDKILNALNAKHYRDEIPEELSDVFDETTYQRSQNYKWTNYRFGIWSSLFSFSLTLGFLILGGFNYVDQLARSQSDNSIVVALLFFGIIMLGADVLSIPFAYYQTFTIEEKFGFNKSSKTTFWADKLKGLLLTILLGGGLLALIVWFYEITTSYFWIYAWISITAFTVFMNMFYTRLFVPLFNKQTPLEKGSLYNKIADYAKSVGFDLKHIFVIDGSKRSSKANAYFSGFGGEKRITLYDTLINDLKEEEIVAVLAHEVGHYKRKHVIINLLSSIVTTGFTLFLLSLFIKNPLLSNALGVEKPSFHAGLLAFGLLYAPISEVSGLFMNYISRKFEYQADNFAKNTYSAAHLIAALKKLSKNSLSNLTPHKAYVWVHYSHPTLQDRLLNLKNNLRN